MLTDLGGLGQVDDGGSYADEMLATLKVWLPTFIHAYATARQVKGLKAPVTWSRRPAAMATTMDQLPAVLVNPGLTEKVSTSKDTQLGASIPLSVLLFARADDWDQTQHLADSFLACVRQIFWLHPDLGSDVANLRFVGEVSGPAENARGSRTLLVARSSWMVDDVTLSSRENIGPLDPPLTDGNGVGEVITVPVPQTIETVSATVTEGEFSDSVQEHDGAERGAAGRAVPSQREDGVRPVRRGRSVPC